MRPAGRPNRIRRARLARFLSTGAAGALLNVVLYAALALGLGVDYRFALAASFALSYLFSFLVHRSWTFAAHDGEVLGQATRFALVTAATTAAALLIAVLFVDTFGAPDNAGAAAGGVLSAPVSFLLHRSFTFGQE